MPHFFYPLLPDLRIDITWSSIRFGRDFPPMYTRVNFFIVGFACFTDLRILLSLWFFHLLAALQVGMTNRLGLATQLSGGGIYHQEFGGLTFFVLASLWVARRHLGRVLRSALGRGEPGEDQDELVSCRWAVWAPAAAALYGMGWLVQAGLRPDLAVLLRIGGIDLYRKARPVFLGIIVGYAFGIPVAILVDVTFFPEEGHSLYWGDRGAGSVCLVGSRSPLRLY